MNLEATEQEGPILQPQSKLEGLEASWRVPSMNPLSFKGWRTWSLAPAGNRSSKNHNCSRRLGLGLMETSLFHFCFHPGPSVLDGVIHIQARSLAPWVCWPRHQLSLQTPAQNCPEVHCINFLGISVQSSLTIKINHHSYVLCFLSYNLEIKAIILKFSVFLLNDSIYCSFFVFCSWIFMSSL
jgi:hypothetical protein